MKTQLKIILIFLLFFTNTFNFSLLTFNSAQAQESTSSAIPTGTDSAAVNPTPTPAPSFMPSATPPIDAAAGQISAPSAVLRRQTQLKPLPRKDYRADEPITAFLLISEGTDFQTDLFNPQGEKQNVEIVRNPNADFTTLRINPSLEFRPGLYTLKVSDTAGYSSETKFTWGMISFNTDQSSYQPGETARFAFSVTDEKGLITCDAKLTLEIKTTGAADLLSTDNGKIIANPDCQKHDFNLKSDYEATYQIPPTIGTYETKITAAVNGRQYEIEDQFEVRENLPFKITRSYPTRITATKWMPMSFAVTANTDFTGTLSEKIASGIDISLPADKNLTSYDSLSLTETTLNSGSVLGVIIPELKLPFDGTYPNTLGFGENLTDPLQIRLYSQFNLTGHDGADFALPDGTPVLAADSGMVVLAGDGDYGTTIAIDHDWGRSYYGHLSQTAVVFGQKVTRGQQIGLSGNTGLSTGSHLHFGIKPKKFDKNNGYYGKINPLPYLESASNVSNNHPLIPSLNKEGKDVGTSPLLPSFNKEGKQGRSVELSTEQATVALHPQGEGELSVNAHPEGVSTAGQAKQLSWNISLKSGETKSFGYQIKAPNVEASSYLAGPLSISYENQPTILAYSEDRFWQLITDVIPQPPGASFAPGEQEFPMETIDPALFNVPADYSFEKAKMDTEIKGKYTNLFLESTSPGWQMAVLTPLTPHPQGEGEPGTNAHPAGVTNATPSGQLNGIKVTFDATPHPQGEGEPSVNAHPEGVQNVNSNRVSWNNIKPNVDFYYDTYDGYIDQKIILKNDATDKDFAFNLDKNENLVIGDYSGHVLIKDPSTEEEFFLFRFPQGIDAQNQRIDYKWEIKQSTASNAADATDNRQPTTSLVLYPSRPWQLKKAVYPITIYAPVNVIGWSEIAVAVGENCAGEGCRKDGDIGDVKPPGWHWGLDERRKNLIVMTDKLTRVKQTELVKKVKSFVPYGIDYSRIATSRQLKIIRDKNKKNFSPQLDIRGKKNLLKKKDDLLSSVIPDSRRLVYKPPTRLERLISKIKKQIFPPVYAQTTVIKSIGSAGRNYSAIQNGSTGWEDDRDGDLTASGSNTIEIGYLYKDSEFDLSATQTFDGSTTDASHYMQLSVAPSDRHKGIPSQGVIIDCQTNALNPGLHMKDNYLRLEWFSITQCYASSGQLGAIALGDGANNVTDGLIRNVIIFNYSGASTDTAGIRMQAVDGNQTLTVRNAVIFDGHAAGIYANASTGTDSITIENCTVDGNNATGGDGIFIGSETETGNITNCISMNNANTDFTNNSVSATNLTNISEDATGTITSKTRANQFVDPDNATSANSDFHLKAGSDAINTGTNLTANFQNDIDDVVRSFDAWDIGADEFPYRTLDVLMRHGKYFGQDGEQPFTF